MKELTSYNRVAGYLNKVFDLLNAEFFEKCTFKTTITIQSTPPRLRQFLPAGRYMGFQAGRHPRNQHRSRDAGRPIEEVAATLLHEMVHYYNYENGIQDCSRGNTYHNRRFKAAAEAHGLIVEHSDKYGWSHTSPSDELLDFILENGLTDILKPQRVRRVHNHRDRDAQRNRHNTAAHVQHKEIYLSLLREFRPSHKGSPHSLFRLQRADGACRVTGKGGEQSHPIPQSSYNSTNTNTKTEPITGLSRRRP